MDFRIGEVLQFENIQVKVIEVKEKSIEFKILNSEKEEGDFREIPLWYIEERKNTLIRVEDKELQLT
ncbi:hypothetical protein [Bacillus massilinigeriensis]|uniref:hypothetical protein n=1 Tax=Bacillus massilionigeriensis TaxID=1805475 RepID=UPI00096B364E|nr:hypothetical protein [Bacillus massilionigeriensis]